MAASPLITQLDKREMRICCGSIDAPACRTPIQCVLLSAGTFSARASCKANRHAPVVCLNGDRTLPSPFHFGPSARLLPSLRAMEGASPSIARSIKDAGRVWQQQTWRADRSCRTGIPSQKAGACRVCDKLTTSKRGRAGPLERRGALWLYQSMAWVKDRQSATNRACHEALWHQLR